MRAHLRRHFKRLLKLPGKYNQTIGQTFLNLIDEAFKHYQEWQLTRNELSYRTWVEKFKNQLEEKLKRYWNQAGARSRKVVAFFDRKSITMVVFFRPPRSSS